MSLDDSKNGGPGGDPTTGRSRRVSLAPPGPRDADDGSIDGATRLDDVDAYAELLSRTRGLPRELRARRDEWFRRLALDGKEDLLFELEVLLKGCACFSNPRNHPGPPRRSPVVAQDFHEPLMLYKDALLHAIVLARQLLGTRDRAFVFHRYLESVLPEDRLRSRLVHEGAEQARPEQALIALRHALTSTVEVTDGLLKAPRTTYRTFYAVLSLVQREVGRNAFFNPLSALEFRPEFDRIKSAQVLELLQNVPSHEAHRLVSLTFLSLFRMLRYLRLLQRITAEAGTRRRAMGRAYVVLSVLRSDARALADYLRRHAGPSLAQSYERAVFGVPRPTIRDRAPELRVTAQRLLEVKGALEGIAANLRLEVRRAFQHDLPPPDARGTDQQTRVAVQLAVASLRPAIRNAILFLGRSLGASLEEGGVFDDEAARRETSERLRRDVWMFAQIVRAFAAKAQHTVKEDDRWGAVHGFQYVREFLAYFRAMGYPLLRAADYPRFEAFLEAMGHIEDTDLVDPTRLEKAIDECVAFNSFLQQLFDDISRRDVLQGVAFDRRAAASSLRMYLGD